MNEQKSILLAAIARMGELTPSQLSRFLFGSGLIPTFDMMAALAELVEGGSLEQKLTVNGVVYFLSEKGREGSGGVTPAGFEEKANEYKNLFEKENDYIAMYTEQATAIFPVFLSIRKGDAIQLHVDLIVDDAATAREITANWMANAHKTYDAIWESIAPGKPQPRALEDKG